MAGKDYKVQKKTKEEQRLSVFQPAFRWGGHNASSSTGSSSKIEAKKNDIPGVRRNDRLDRRQNERVDQPRRNDNRLAITEDPEAKMARDAKRMTTFQPIFGSLFSSKPSKGKGPEQSQHIQGQRPLANGPTSQQSSRNQVNSAARPDAGYGASGGSRGGRSGPGYQGAGLRINTHETLGSNSRRNDATSNSSGRAGRGGLAPVPEGYSPRPRSPLQRNPPISTPADDVRPLGISNAFGAGARGKEKANVVGNVPANTTDFSSNGTRSDPRSNGHDQGLGIAMSSAPTTSRNVSQPENQMRSGSNVDIDPATKRERMGIGFRRDDRGAAEQPRLSETPIRKPVMTKSESQADPRSRTQTVGRTLGDAKLEQPPVGRSQNVPQLVVTDTSDISSSKGSSRQDRPSRSQQNVDATSSKVVPGRGPDTVREASGSIRADGRTPPASNGTDQPSARSPLDLIAQSLSTKATETTQDVPSGRSRDVLQREMLSRDVPSQAGASKSSLSVFPKQWNQARQPISVPEPEAVNSKRLDILRSTKEREDVNKSSQVREALTTPETRSIGLSSTNLHSDASANRQLSQKVPLETLISSSSKTHPQFEALKTTNRPSGDSNDLTKAHVSDEKQQIAYKPLVSQKPGVRDEANTSSNPLKNGMLGRVVGTRSEEKARPLKASQFSSAGSSVAKPEQSFAENPAEMQAGQPESFRSVWASRYFETPRNDKLDNNLPKVERQLDSAKVATSTAVSRETAPNEDRQISEAAPRDGTSNSGAVSFKQRMQNGLGAGKESSLLKPLKSKFNAPKRQDTSQTLPEQTSQPLAGDAQVPQVDATTQPNQQREPSASLERPRKEYQPYSAAKKASSSEAKSGLEKIKAPIVPEWLPPSKSDTPSRPERPQDELFMGVSGSALRPSPPFGSTAPLKPSRLPDLRSNHTSPKDTDTRVPEVSNTCKATESTRAVNPEQDSREYTLVTAGTPVNLSGETSRSAKPQASAVRVVSGIIERPKEIDIQKSSRPAKTTKPSTSEIQSNMDVAEAPEIIPSRQAKKAGTKQIDSSFSQVSEIIQPGLETQPGDRHRDQSWHSEKNETQKRTRIGEWPRPIPEPSTAAQKDVVDRSRAVVGDKASGSEVQIIDKLPRPPLLDAETSQSRGLLGRWGGRGKRDKTPELSNQSLAARVSPVIKELETTPTLESEPGGQSLPPRHVYENVGSAIRPGQPTRDNMDVPGIQVFGPTAQNIVKAVDTPKLTSVGVTGHSSSTEVTSPPQVQSASEQGHTDAPAPLRVGGRSQAQLVESESQSREEFKLHLFPSADKQDSTNGKLIDRDVEHNIRARDLDVTSPPLPSQEDFFQKMRQSVMFQKAESTDKTDLPESTETTSKRKSRRNRNFSISGLQPTRGVVPEMPTWDNQSTVGGGDSAPYSSLAHTAPDSWPEQASLGNSQRRDVFGERPANEMSNLSTDKPTTPDRTVLPVTLAGQSRAYATEQAEPQSADIGYKSQMLPATDTTVRGFKESPALDAPLSATSGGPRIDTKIQKDNLAHVTESVRNPLHPASSSSDVFRQPSFGEQEEVEHQVTTHDLPASATKADPKVQDFFQGVFKSKKSPDFASSLGSRSFPNEDNSREGQHVDLTNGESMKRLSASPQAVGASEDMLSLNGDSSPSSIPHGQAYEPNLEQPKVDTRSSFELPRFPTQTAMEVPTSKLAPTTPHQHIMTGVEIPSVPRELTSKSPEIAVPHVTGKATEDPSPYSIDVPMLFVEDAPASPVARNEPTKGHWHKSLDSPSTSGRENGSPEGRASPREQAVDRQDASNTPSQSYRWPGHQSPEEPNYNRSRMALTGDGGLNTSPQDSEGDLSDQILSLYDGSGYATPDHQSAGESHKHIPSSREVRTPTTFDHTSAAPVESRPAETLEPTLLSPATKDPVTPELAMDGGWNLHPLAESTHSIATPTRELSDLGNAETETMEPTPSRSGGIKDKLRMVFSKNEDAERSYDSHAQPAVASSITEAVCLPAVSEKKTGPQEGDFMSSSFNSPDLESEIEDMGHEHSRTPSGGANFASTRSEVDIGSGPPSPRLVEQNHLTEQAISPELSRDFAAPIHVDEQEGTPSQPIVSTESQPAKPLMTQWDDPSKLMSADHPREEVLSPDFNHPPVSVSPLPASDDGDHFPLLSHDGMSGMDEFGTQSQREHAVETPLLPGSSKFEADYDAISLRATPDLHDAQGTWSNSPGEVHHIATSPINDLGAFDHVAPFPDSRGATKLDDEHLQISPENTPHYGAGNHLGDHFLPEHDETQVTQSRMSEPDLESPGSVHDAFQSGARPVSQEDKDWATDGNNHMQGLDDRSPQSTHVDELLLGEPKPENAMATTESPAHHGPEDEPWNEGFMPTGSYTPDTNDRYHGLDDDTVIGDAEPAFDTAAEYRDDLNVPDSRFATEHGDTRDDFHDTLNDDLHTGHQDGPQEFTHTEETDSAVGNDERVQGGFDEFGGGHSPASDSHSGIGGFKGTEEASYPIDEHQSHEGGFHDFPGDRLPLDDLQRSSAAFDSPRVGSPPIDDFPVDDGGFQDHMHVLDGHQDNIGGSGDGVMEDHYPAENTLSPGGAFEDTGYDDYPASDIQGHPPAFHNAETDQYPLDDFTNDPSRPVSPVLDHYGAGDLDEVNTHPSDTWGEEPPPPYEPDHDFGHSPDDSAGFDPRNDELPYEEPAFSDHGAADEFTPETDRMVDDNQFHDEYPRDEPLEDHFETDGLPLEEPELSHQGSEMDFVDNRKGDLDDLSGGEEWNGHGQDAELDHGLDEELSDLDGEPVREMEAEPMDFSEGGPIDQGEALSAGWEGDHLDEGRGLDGADEYPMDGGEDFPMGGEAEEYMLGGGGMHSPAPMEAEEPPLGGEAEEYLMGGQGDYQMDSMDEGDDFRVAEDEELPIGEMYGTEERSLEPLDEEEFPMEDDEPFPAMDSEEYPMDGQDQFPIDGQDEMEGQDQLPMDEQDGFPMEGDDMEGSDRGMDDFDANDQFGDEMSIHDSVLDEKHGSQLDEEPESQLDDGSVEGRSLADEEAGTDFGEEDMDSDISDPFDEEPIGDYEPEDEEYAPSENEDREIEEGPTSLAGEEDEEMAEEGEGNMDDLYEAEVPSIPTSPTSTDYGRELASPTSTLDHDEAEPNEDSIFGEIPAQQDLVDPANADPVRLSCLYTQDVGLMSIPSTPTVPQADETPEQGEEEQEEPREPVRFSALYRQSLDWSQALDSSLWEDFEDIVPEEDEEQVVSAPVLQPVPESAEGGSQEDLRMLEVAQESLTPIAASPLSPRPLETPPPDFDLQDTHQGHTDAHQLAGEPGELNKGTDDDTNQRYPTSPRLQPTPPPEQSRTSSSIDMNDQRDSRGPRTFDEMNLPRRVISPPNAGEDQSDPGQGPSSTYVPTYNGRRSISQRFSGWWSGAGSSAQSSGRPPPLPTPYDSRYGEPSSPI